MNKEITFKNIRESGKELSRTDVGDVEKKMHLRIIEESVRELEQDYQDSLLVVPIAIELDEQSKKFLKSIKELGKDL